MNQLLVGTGSNSSSSFKGLVLTTPAKNKICLKKPLFYSLFFFFSLPNEDELVRSISSDVSERGKILNAPLSSVVDDVTGTLLWQVCSK